MTANPTDVVAEALAEEFIDARPYAEAVVSALRDAGLLVTEPPIEATRNTLSREVRLIADVIAVMEAEGYATAGQAIDHLRDAA